MVVQSADRPSATFSDVQSEVALMTPWLSRIPKRKPAVSESGSAVPVASGSGPTLVECEKDNQLDSQELVQRFATLELVFAEHVEDDESI